MAPSRVRCCATGEGYTAASFTTADGVLHNLRLVKSDIREPVLYGLILMGLLGYRLWGSLRRAPGRQPGLL